MGETSGFGYTFSVILPVLFSFSFSTRRNLVWLVIEAIEVATYRDRSEMSATLPEARSMVER